VLRPLLAGVGVIPLRRAADERRRATASAPHAGAPTATPAAAPTAADPAVRRPLDPPVDSPVDPRRNAEAFDAIVDALARQHAVLIFPEGISHDAPAIAPLRTGLARIALQSLGSGRVGDVAVLPVGLTFERKWRPRSSVLVTIGEPIELSAGAALPDVRALTERVEGELRRVTLNFETPEAAEQVLEMSRPLAALFEGVLPLDALDVPTSGMVRVARRLDAARRVVHELSGQTRERIDRFLARLASFRFETERLGLRINDVEISTGARAGAWFVARELAIAVAVGPAAIWGRVNHWLPLRLARWYARRASASPEDPAMHTVVSGLVLVIAFYVAQTALVGWLAGAWWGVLYLLSLPGSATCDFWYAERLRRAVHRARAYLRFRRDPVLHRRLARESEALRAEADALAEQLGVGAAARGA
jgi:1-acyl-sn-glycerol-3-phosphate acyltransferase